MKTDISRLPIRLKLTPGQAGTRKLLSEHGDQLVCVRYRYDPAGRRRYKTAEIIVDEAAWWPGRHKLKPDSIVRLWTYSDELNLHDKIRQHGGVWDHRHRNWRIRYQEVCKLRLQDRIVVEDE